LLAVLARSADASEPLSVFCQAAAQETARGFTAVSIVLLDGLKTVAAVGAWPESLSALAIWQFQERHGPCYDACSAEGTVTATDLSGAGVRRWPLWAPAAAALGLGAVSSQPLRRNGQVIGSLLLGTADDEPLEPAMLPDIGSAARVAVELAMTRRDLDDAHLRAAQLQRALDSRVVVEQAKGRLSVEFGCTVDEAFEWLRRHARSTNRKLHDLATEVVDGRLPTDMLRAASKDPWPGSGTLTIELTAHGLRLAGHADPIDVDAVAARMRVAAAASTRVVVDLSQLEGCDAAVAQALIDEQRSARPRTRVVLDSPRAPVATLLSALKASERPGITIRQAAKP
jgi:anti-anti-sigma regulatory factor